MTSRIGRKLLLYFAAALLLFTLIIGVIFIALFRAQILNTHKQALEMRALSIAGALSDYMGSAEAGGRGSMMSSGRGGFGVYLRFIDDIAMSDVWVVDENLQLITGNMMTHQNYLYTDLPTDAGKVVKAVFEGKTTFSEDFSSLLDAPTLTVGTPITVNKKVVGAVLLHSPVGGIEAATTQGIRILGVSIVVAFALSALLSVFLALTFTRPLNKMKASARLLAEGDYSVKTGVRLNDEIGELADTLDVLSDKLLAARAQSEKLDKLRRDFIANISHELKTPVTVIRGSLEALCDEVVTEPQQVKDYLKQMLGESRMLQRLINDLLDLTKLQNSDFKIEMQPLNLCDILSDAIRSAAYLAQQKGIAIQHAFDTPFVTVIGDYGRLRQMLLIVLDNAVKFSPDGGVVAVSLSNAAVTVKDCGPGIAKEDLPYIFDRFYKARSEQNKTGSGLGLAIARQIAQRHGVTLSAKSNPGEGSEFKFEFTPAV